MNNEGIVACVATQVVCCGFRKVSEVVAVTNLLMHEDMRKEVKNMVSNKNLGAIMNRIDGGLLTITMNSLALMVMGLHKGAMDCYSAGKLHELNPQTRNKLYVACTRAHRHLYLMSYRRLDKYRRL